MDYLPVFIRLQGQDVLLVGGGTVAARKARLLIAAGARVRIVATELCAELRAARSEQTIDWIARIYSDELIDGARLVYAATDDPALNQTVWADAERKSILVNTVDDRDHCRFISPAIVDRSPLVVAISTAGAAPLLARRIRSKIEHLLPQALGRIADLAGGFRKKVAMLPAARRRHVWEQVLSEEHLDRWCEVKGQYLESEMSSALTHAIESSGEDSANRGRVYLVGAGPGDPELLTWRAIRLLQQADVVVHDRLVSTEILDQARRDADRIDVGKRAGQASISQQQINRILLEQSSKGKLVVRLKGGDPTVFGRGGEEREFLLAHGVHCDLVPGITAAVGCAAAAGIPLTHRKYAQALSLVTGHQVSKGIDWTGLAGEGRTLVIYMGLRQAGRIRAGLLAAGISADWPAMLVVNGTLPNQRLFRGTVNELERLVERAGTRNPGLLVIGQVINAPVIVPEELQTSAFKALAVSAA